MATMYHMFDIEVAERYGVNSAIIFQNIGFWIEHNKANGTNFYDGRYWTYNSHRDGQVRGHGPIRQPHEVCKVLSQGFPDTRWRK